MNGRNSIPKLSVVIPVKDGAHHIEDCIRSLYAQTFQDFEIVVVDNQSTDLTVSLCKALLDSRGRVVSNPGDPIIAEALNLGIHLASGSYIARIDSDDVARSDRFEKQVKFLDENPDIAIVGSWMQTFGERKAVWKYPETPSGIKISLLYRSPFGHPAVMFRAKWDRGRKGFYDPNFNLAEDLELWSRICAAGRGANLAETLTYYRVHTSQETKSRQTERELCVGKIVAQYCDLLALPRPPAVTSLWNFMPWWFLIAKTAAASGAFDRSLIVASAVRHASILGRQAVRLQFRRLGILSRVLAFRDSVERKVQR